MSGATPRVFRPATREYVAWVKKPDPVALAFVIVLVGLPILTAAVRWLLFGERAGLLILLALVVLGVVIGLGGSLLSMRTSSVTLSDATVEHRRWWVRRTVLPRDGLRGILCDYRPPMSQKSSLLLVLQHREARGPRIRLNGAFWDGSDLASLAEAAGVPQETRELRARDVESRLPGIMRFQERRPAVFLALFPITVLLIGLVGGGLYVALGDGGDRTDQFPASTASGQDALVRDVAAAVDVSWRGRAFVAVSDCDTATDGLVRRVERRTDLSVTGDAVAQAARGVEAVARDAGLSDVETDVTPNGFEISAGDGDSSFEGGASLDVEYDDGALTLESSSRCVTP